MSRKLAIGILEKEGSVSFKCNGRSMEPIMYPGDRLHIKKVPVEKLRIGDAIFCKINGNLQVHKITNIDNVHDGRWEISNNRGYRNGWIGRANIYGLCVMVEDQVLITDEELMKR